MKPAMTPDQPAPKIVVCPACKGKSIYAPSNAFRPFGSGRCKNMDLGAWASESFRMPADTPPDDEFYGGTKFQ